MAGQGGLGPGEPLPGKTEGEKGGMGTRMEVPLGTGTHTELNSGSGAIFGQGSGTGALRGLTTGAGMRLLGVGTGGRS